MCCVCRPRRKLVALLKHLFSYCIKQSHRFFLFLWVSVVMGKQIQFNRKVKVLRGTSFLKAFVKRHLSNTAEIMFPLQFLEGFSALLKPSSVCLHCYLGPPKWRSAGAHKLLYKNIGVTIGLLKLFGSPNAQPIDFIDFPFCWQTS